MCIRDSFGAARVLLLGYNMGRVAGRNHFYDTKSTGEGTSDNHYATMRRLFDTLVAPLKAAGVEVWNCTPRSALAAFPFAQLSDVLLSLIHISEPTRQAE